MRPCAADCGGRRRGGCGGAPGSWRGRKPPPALTVQRPTCALTTPLLHQEQCGYAPLVMVGDGATDAEARRPGAADVFIGYGGAVRRPAVAAAADWYVLSIQPLLDALE